MRCLDLASEAASIDRPVFVAGMAYHNICQHQDNQQLARAKLDYFPGFFSCGYHYHMSMIIEVLLRCPLSRYGDSSSSQDIQ